MIDEGEGEAKRLDLNGLATRASAFDDLVNQTPGIDHFCSSTAWCLPAARGLMPGREPYIYLESGAGLALMRSHHPGGVRVLESLESMWGLASVSVGEPRLSRALLVEVLASCLGEWDVAWLTGVPRDSTLAPPLALQLSAKWNIRHGPVTERLIADLSGGFDAYLARRSRSHRKNLRRVEKRGGDYQFEWVTTGDAETAFERLMAVEQRSWKGLEAVGISGSGMGDFYRLMMRALWPRGGIRLMFVRDGGKDVAFILGALAGTSYRGLQFAYDDAYRGAGLGHLCQLKEIESLCELGVVTYDLGTSGLAYKEVWSDRRFETLSLIVYA